MNQFPWKKGDGTRIVTVSIPVILNPVINKLQGKRELSSTIAEYLWLRYGENHTDINEREIAVMMKEKQILNDRIKELEESSLRSRDLDIQNQRLSELKKDIQEHRKIRNILKNYPNKWKWDKSLLNVRELNQAQLILEQFGSEDKFIHSFDEWVRESNELTVEIGKSVSKNV